MPARLPRIAALRILLDHADELPAIIAAFDDLVKPESLQEAWDDTKHTGDLLVPIAQEVADTFREDRFRGLCAAGDMDAMKSEAEAKGINWSKVMEHLDKILAIIEFALRQYDIDLGSDDLTAVG